MNQEFIDLWSWLEDLVTCSSNTGNFSGQTAANFFKQQTVEVQRYIAQQFQQAMKKLDRPATWVLGSLLFGQPIGDDSFNDFRRWLIFQGPDAFRAATETPDEFYKRAGNSITNKNIFFEWAPWVDEVFDTPHPIFEMKAPTWTTPAHQEFSKILPQTFAALGHGYAVNPPDEQQPESFEVQGLGIVKVGDSFRHKGAFGIGKITAIRFAETGCVDIQFANEKKTMSIREKFFERI